MDLILTPLVTRILKQYVKRSSEGAGSDLKVRSMAAGGAVWQLHSHFSTRLALGYCGCSGRLFVASIAATACA
jgi:hypothetical protein